MSESGKHRRFGVYMSQVEIEEYFSRDLEFDWPFEDKYEPPFPLTPTEENLVRMNAPSSQVVSEIKNELYLLNDERVRNLSDVASWVNEELARARMGVQRDQDIIHGPNRKHWPSDSDAVLFNYTDGLGEIMAGYPTKIKYYLLKLKSYRYYYVYSVDDNIIMTPEEYLSKFDKREVRNVRGT